MKRRVRRILNPHAGMTDTYVARHDFAHREPLGLEVVCWAALARHALMAADGKGDWREIVRRLRQLTRAGVFNYEHGGPVCAGLYEVMARGVRLHDRARFVTEAANELRWYAEQVSDRCKAAREAARHSVNDNRAG